MNDGVHTGQGASHSVTVTDIAHAQDSAGVDRLLVPVLERVENYDVCSLVKECTDGDRADVSRSTCDEHAHPITPLAKSKLWVCSLYYHRRGVHYGEVWMTQLAGKTVCVTGGAGFLGSVLTEKLKAADAEVFVPLQADYDLTDPEAVRRCLDDSSPDMVIHLAAVVGGIGANQANPGRFYYDNAVMALHLVHESYTRGVEKFVGIGTICAYPKHTPVPFQESELWNGYPEETNAPYGLAKKMMLVQLQAYRAQYGFNGIYLLPVNLYGPGDNFDLESSHVIPAMVRKMVTARDEGAPEVVLWGDGTPTREFLYVEDCAEAIAAAADRYDGSDPVNLGSGSEISMRDLAATIAKHVGYEGELTWDTSRPNGQPRRMLDTSRARERFGWQAKTSFDTGLENTIRWWESHR